MNNKKFETNNDYQRWVISEAKPEEMVVLASAWKNVDGSLNVKTNVPLLMDYGIRFEKNKYKKSKEHPDYIIRVKRKKYNYKTGEILI